MAHAEHFLSRLERLAPRDVEVALSLYRNNAVVAEVIERAAILGAERVALALGREPGGPHLVVTARGDFVTCLGPGMALSGLTAIPRATLDAVVERRKRESLADQLAGGEGRGGRLLGRLLNAYDLSREEFLAISAYQPALELRFILGLVESFLETRRLTERCQAREKVPPEVFEVMWRLTLAQGHYAALVGLSARTFLESNEDYTPATTFLARAPILTGHFGSSMRGLWAVSRLGKEHLLRTKRLLGEDSDTMTVASRIMEIAVLGLGHSKLLGEARKALRRDVGCYAEPHRKFVEVLLTQVGRVLDEPDFFAARQLALGQILCAQIGTALPADSPYAFPVAEEVPEPLARAALANSAINLWERGRLGLVQALACLPFVARAQAEDLYLPEAVLAAWGWRCFNLQDAQRHIAEFKDFKGREQPVVRAGPRVSRNAPCPCGSGKKHKRCCADAGTEPAPG